MKRRTRWVMAAGLAAVVVGLLVLAGWMVWSATRNGVRVKRLPDGSYLKIYAVEYGRSIEYRPPGPSKWQKFMLKHFRVWSMDHLARWWPEQFGPKEFDGPVVGKMAGSGGKELEVLTITTGDRKTAANYSRLQLDVRDEEGRQYGPVSLQYYANNKAAGGHTTMLWTLNPPAISGKWLVLRFSLPAGDARGQGVDFRVVNPMMVERKKQ